MTGARAIFITNNEVADHIGVAQVLPYLQALAGLGHHITLVSVEDPKRWQQNAPSPILTSDAKGSLQFAPIFRKSGVLGRLQRFVMPFQMRRRLRSLIAKDHPDLIHCRSYMPLAPSLAVAKSDKIKLLFDVRGFWVDQRIEGGAWSPVSPLDAAKIKHFRKVEARGYGEATRIVTLTHDAKDVIAAKPSYQGAPIDIIPCSVDQSKFDISATDRAENRATLGVSDDTVVISYLGSNSGVYRMDLVYQIYAAARLLVPSAKLLLIGRHDLESHLRAASGHGVVLSKDEVETRLVAHHEVPQLLNASDIGLSFQVSTPSSLGVSATKVGEYMACGLPVGSNHGVGDIERIVRPHETGSVLRDDSPVEVDRVAKVLVEMALKGDRASIKAHGREFYSLDEAVARYDRIYRDLSGEGDNGPRIS